MATDTSVMTLLFTDLVASTELSQALGEDAAEEVRRLHLATLRKAIGACGGREVKGLGDGVMVVFTSPSQAATCAVTMQQAVDLENRRSPHPLGLRVGLHVGEVTHENGDYFGTAVVVAERLCGLARAGQILASDVLRALVGTRGDLRFDDVGLLDLKGIPHPVAAVEALWDPRPQSTAVPLPHRLSLENANPFVGREAERQTLRQAFKRATDGERQLVFLVGEPGIGKSRLCAEFATETHGEGAAILYGRCDEESLAPYQPVVEALRHYVAHVPDDVLTGPISDVAADLVPLVPDLSRRVTDLPAPPALADPEADRLRVFDAVTGALAAVAASTSLVVILDDLHWADRPTLQLLRHLLRAPPFGVVIVATYRETDLDRTHPLSTTLADLRREHPFERLHLKGLMADDVVSSLERLAGHDVGRRGRALAEALVDASDGNPFFIEQIVGHLVETGRIYARDGQWTFDTRVEDLGIPEGVKEVIGRRLSGLGEGANRALAVASVVGRDFSLDLIEAVSDLDEDALVDVMDEAVAAGIVAEVAGVPGRYTFTHALVREALYEELTATRRVRLHRRLAQVLEQRAEADPDAHAAELAHHFLEAAQITDIDKAVAYARRAAERAVGLTAFEEAERLYERALGALDLADHPPEAVRGDLLLGLGAARWKGGEVGASREAFLEARAVAQRTDDPELLARAALGFAGPPESPMALEESPRISLEEAAAVVGDRVPAELQASVLARLSVVWLFEDPGNERAPELAGRALELIRGSKDPAALAFVHRNTLMANYRPGELAAAHAGAEEILRLALEAGDEELEFWGRGHRYIVNFARGHLDAARADLDAMDGMAARLRQAFFSWSLAMWHTGLTILTAAPAEAERHILESFSLGAERWPVIAGQGMSAQLALLRWHQGRMGELEAPIRDLMDRFPQAPAWKYALSLLLVDDDRLAEAAEIFEDLSMTGFHNPPNNGGWDTAMSAGANVCWRLGRADWARIFHERLLPVADDFGLVGPAWGSVGPLARSLGLTAATMERWDEAEAHLLSSIEACVRVGARCYLARNQADLAEVLATRGDTRAAESLAREAMASARDLGLAKVEEQTGRTLEMT